MGTIYEKLAAYGESDYYAFHMPGHKRNTNLKGMNPVCKMDITEIEGFDDLHHADGILKEAQERAARVYGADETHFLVNGSTVGILSAILGETRRGDSILVARNCHKSVYHAIYMNELRPVYLYPGYNEELGLNMEISAEKVKEKLKENPDVRVVVIVSPTYDGVVSDVEAIARAVHESGALLIVDEAHGAHLGFHPYFPENANRRGADIVIHSVHKTLPSLTQTALLHMNGTLVRRERVRTYLHMLQSSSPSYILMAGIDSCIGMLAGRRQELFDPYVKMLQDARKELKGLRRLRLAEAEGSGGFDDSKLIISTRGTGRTGKELYDLLLTKYHLQMEMAAGDYIIAMTSPGDTEEGFGRLVRALREIDEELAEDRAGEKDAAAPPGAELVRLAAYCTSAEAERLAETGQRDRNGAVRYVPFLQSAGAVSLEYVYLYPPGIPFVVPGERITEEAVQMLVRYESAGYTLEGLKKEGQIKVFTDGTDILYNG